ncbi:unnamed protein product [Prorocentrum cordatum]|uniref:Uncharacterized protein n=1 Tax=Prorocentrum cordatum TaxID=2364126 RepID=A0ABN9RCN5_9DINO|nr:unnamed protein product [Polarella glacialis]
MRTQCAATATTQSNCGGHAPALDATAAEPEGLCPRLVALRGWCRQPPPTGGALLSGIAPANSRGLLLGRAIARSPSQPRGSASPAGAKPGARDPPKPTYRGGSAGTEGKT